MALHLLVSVFEHLTVEGFCEEDMLDAFISHLNQLRTSTNNDEEAGLLQNRIDSLQRVAEEWVRQNEEASPDWQDLDDD